MKNQLQSALLDVCTNLGSGFNEAPRTVHELLCHKSKDLFVEEQDTNVCVTVVFLFKYVLCVAVGPREEDEVVDCAWLECLLGRLSQTLRCRKVKDIKKQQNPPL